MSISSSSLSLRAMMQRPQPGSLLDAAAAAAGRGGGSSVDRSSGNGAEDALDIGSARGSASLGIQAQRARLPVFKQRELTYHTDFLQIWLKVIRGVSFANFLPLCSLSLSYPLHHPSLTLFQAPASCISSKSIPSSSFAARLDLERVHGFLNTVLKQ